ncbi:TonB-dependent receptor [Chitinophaga sp. 22321]|uniref:TonB-dependent receptor n=1 Tax=Chitinophaga hostae TaxID=2831022 RepID=A0ABS5J5H0_9BACT|nr:TonB-dependent receptor [Chitinophaga hostae]MBS0030419.1 TonB-dependent receptor [Chitinophaga hostae]
MKRNFLALMAGLLCSLFANAQDSLSQQKDSSRTLREVVVTYQAGKTTPVTWQNINMKMLEEKNTGQEPTFLLSATPSITVYSDAGNQQGYSYYRLRGMDQTRINTTLDGMPLNEPEDQGAYFSNYPDILNSVSQLQIQRGAGTSKNGAASYAGSLQLFSPQLSDSAKTTIGAGYGAYNSFRIFGEYNSGIKNRKALYVRASQIYTDGYKYHAFNNSQSIFISGGLFYDKSTWKVNVMAGHQQNGMAWLPVADSLIAKDKRTNANTKAEKDQFFQGLVQLQNVWQPALHSTITSSLYYTFLKGGYGFDVNNFSGLPTDGNLFHYNFRSHFGGFFSNYTLTYNRFKWISGIHGNIYTRQHRGTDDLLGELYKNDGYKNDLSAFSKIEYYLHRFTLYADMQYRYTSFDYKGSVAFPQMNWHFLNPKAGVSFAIDRYTSLYYSIGKTGREPTRNDIFGGNDDLSADSIGKPFIYNRDPESVTDQELGIRINSRRLAFQVNGYYMDFKNEIVLNGQLGPNGLLLTNKVSRSFRTGLELYADYQLTPAFSLTNNSSFNYSRIKEQTATFSPVLTPALIINQEAVYHYRHWLLAVSGRYQGRSYIDFANEATIKAYVLVNARLQYSLQRYIISFFINNISNTEYYNNGSVVADGSVKYFVQAPRNMYVAFKYSF